MTSLKWATVDYNKRYCHFSCIFYLQRYRMQVYSSTFFTYFFHIFIHIIVKNDSWATMRSMFSIETLSESNHILLKNKTFKYQNKTFFIWSFLHYDMCHFGDHLLRSFSMWFQLPPYLILKLFIKLQFLGRRNVYWCI